MEVTIFWQVHPIMSSQWWSQVEAGAVQWGEMCFPLPESASAQERECFLAGGAMQVTLNTPAII